MNFDVNTPWGYFFNYVEELLDIDTITLYNYTDNHYIKLVYIIINKTDQYRIGIWEWNKKDTPKKNCLHSNRIFAMIISNWNTFLKTVVAEGFQSAHIVAQVVDYITKVLHQTDYDTEYTLFQMYN